MAESEHNIHIAPEDLSAYADEEALDSRERERIEQHLETCEACRQELAELSAIQQLLADLPEPELPRSFRLSPEDVGERDEGHGPAPMPIQPWLLRHQSTFRVAAMAAALLLALVVTIDLLPEGSSGSSDDEDADIGTLDGPRQETAQDEARDEEAAMEEAPQDDAREDAAEPGPGISGVEEDDEAAGDGEADMETAGDADEGAAPEAEDDAAAPESGDDPADTAGGADEEAAEVPEDEEEAAEAPEEQEESAADRDEQQSTAGTSETPATGDDADVASEPDTPEDPDEGYNAEALQESDGDDGISTLRLIAIALAVVTVLLAVAGFLLPRWWQSASR